MLGHEATLSGSTVTLGKLTNIDWSGIEVNDVQNTQYDATDGYETYEPGTKEPGTITGILNFDKGQVTTVKNAIDSDTTDTFTLTLADGSTLACSGHIKSMGLATPLRESVTIPVGIKLSGKPTWTPVI